MSFQRRIDGGTLMVANCQVETSARALVFSYFLTSYFAL